MKTELEKRIKANEVKRREWYSFAYAITDLDDEDIKAQGLDNQRLVWVNDEAEYKLDPTTLGIGQMLSVEKSDIPTNYEFTVGNFHLRNGLDACLKQIQDEVSMISFRIKLLKNNLPK